MRYLSVICTIKTVPRCHLISHYCSNSCKFPNVVSSGKHDCVQLIVRFEQIWWTAHVAIFKDLHLHTYIWPTCLVYKISHLYGMTVQFGQCAKMICMHAYTFLQGSLYCVNDIAVPIQHPTVITLLFTRLNIKCDF